MGEHQCPHCGHITTGFEQAEFEAKKAIDDAEAAEIRRLRAALEDIASGLSVRNPYHVANEALGRAISE